MATTLDQLREWMKTKEGEHLEFKAASGSFDSRELTRYCAALANEGGGKMVLGISNKIPRSVIGSKAFTELDRTKAGLVRDLHLRVDGEEVAHPDGRVVIFNVPSRPAGVPVQYEGAYWMRAGESLVPMTQDMLKRIFAETEPDFSATVCPGASLDDLDRVAVERFRALWLRKSGTEAIKSRQQVQLLSDCELLVDGKPTYAALALLGAKQALARHLAQAEVIFEYRSADHAIEFSKRMEFREGFFLWMDELWNSVNERNDVQHYQDGLFVCDIPTFSEASVREVILNAICHRDYRLAGSVFVKQWPRRLRVISPGGFPPGITPDNVLHKQSPRNRRIAEALSRCGLVERSGQGMDRIVGDAVRFSKPLPDFTGTDEYQVSIALSGKVSDPRFIAFLEEVSLEKGEVFALEDLLVLDLLHREQPVPGDLRSRLRGLAAKGVIEPLSRGRGRRFILSQKFHAFLGSRGEYTRRRGLDHETNKHLLLRHIQANEAEGSRFADLAEVLPQLSRGQVQRLLAELDAEGQINHVGKTKGSRWFPKGARPSRTDAAPNET